MLTFQEVLLRLQRYWADQGALLWLPYSEKVGAGTYNPASILRVLGPEPWNVVYIEPSYRPDDGRYGENPNRMQMHTQLQVILKPDPGDPQERYLKSLEALGIRRDEHDIRFVEDNWESPALGAWGLGWEVWLDGQEITQFTYFQQAGGVSLDVPAVEITYGLERIVMYLQGARSVWDLAWDEQHTYGEIVRDQEIDYCRYDFDHADIGRLKGMYDLFEAEAKQALEHGLAMPALDYVLRCSHTFNLLDSRGTVGVTERAVFFKRMRELTRRVAEAYLAQRDRAGFPWQGRSGLSPAPSSKGAPLHLPFSDSAETSGTLEPQDSAPFLFEIGVEELPATHLSDALQQLSESVPAALDTLRLTHGQIHVWGTPRRLALYIEGLATHQPDEERVVRGPAARAAFDPSGAPTRAAEGFARSRGVPVEALEVVSTDGGEYVVARQQITGKPAAEVLAVALPSWIADLRFPRGMRWNQSNVSFSRPIRWLVALLGSQVIPFRYADLESGRTTRGPRPAGSPDVALASAASYRPTLATYGVIVDTEARGAEIWRQVLVAASQAGGEVHEDPDLLDEVTNLVEVPTAVLGNFEKRYLTLPQDVLIAVMKKHQRYFPVFDQRGRLMPHFITVRNGGHEQTDLVRQGNEDVIRARYADAEFFFNHDCRRPLADHREGLRTLTFQAQLGSMLEKAERLERLALATGQKLELDEATMITLQRAAYLAKADLATKMVIEMTSLQGIMGREYARRSGESPAVAQAIYEHYLPRSAGDRLPESVPGTLLALLDRIDSLAGLFAAGMAPTGSADPYGLRRAAAGVVQIMIERGLPLSTRDLLIQAAEALPVPLTGEGLAATLTFIGSRLQGMLREQGFAYDVVEAVLAECAEFPLRARLGAEQLTSWVAREDWPLILDNYARCVRITRSYPRLELLPEALTEPAELDLYNSLRAAEAQLSRDSSVDQALTAFVPLVPAIQRFFNDVLVMAGDTTLRQARLALLQRIAALTHGIADLSKLEGF